MKLKTVVAALFLAIFCFVAPANAVNSDHVTQLLESRICIRCDLRGADLHQADLRGVNLTRADLSQSDLREANLAAANLLDANLRNANLEGADLLVTNLVGANLRHASLLQSQVDTARICNTIAPDGTKLDWDCEDGLPSGEEITLDEDVELNEILAAPEAEAVPEEAVLEGAVPEIDPEIAPETEPESQE